MANAPTRSRRRHWLAGKHLPARRAEPRRLRGAVAQARFKPTTLVYYTTNAPASVVQAQNLAFQLKQIGIELEVKYFDAATQVEKIHTRGEPFDIARDGWAADYLDGGSFLETLLDGKRIRPTGSLNVAYFDDLADERQNRRGEEADGDARRRAWQDLDVELMRTNPPGHLFNLNTRSFVSKLRLLLHHPLYGVDLAAAKVGATCLALRPRGAALCGEPSRTLPQVVRARAGAELCRPARPHGRGSPAPSRDPRSARGSGQVSRSGRRARPRRPARPPRPPRRRAVDGGGREDSAASWSPCRNPHTNSGRPQLAHDLGLKQRGEPVLGLFARNVLEDRDRELAPEHGGDLRQPARTVREPVDPGDEEALEGRWKQEDGFRVVVHVRCRVSSPPASTSERRSSSR